MSPNMQTRSPLEPRLMVYLFSAGRCGSPFPRRYKKRAALFFSSGRSWSYRECRWSAYISQSSALFIILFSDLCGNPTACSSSLTSSFTRSYPYYLLFTGFYQNRRQNWNGRMHYPGCSTLWYISVIFFFAVHFRVFTHILSSMRKLSDINRWL